MIQKRWQRGQVLGGVLLLVLTLVAASLPSGVMAATTLHVTDCADTGANTLRGQIAAAGAGDTIVYDQDCTTTLTSAITIDKNLTIDGSGHAVILDGNHATQVITVNRSLTVTLDTLTIRNGSASRGGAINNAGTLTVTNSTFSDNSTSDYGGAIYNDSRFSATTLAITNSTFSSNSATYHGGAIYNDGYFNPAIVTITNSTFSDNSAVQFGGVIDDRDGTLTFIDSTFSGNHTSLSGGAIYAYTDTLTLINSTFSGNSSSYGGGISDYASTLTSTNSTFSGNTATYDGGGIYNNTSTLKVSNSTFYGNSALHAGGAIFNSGGATLTNTLLANSPDGGDLSGSASGNNNLIDDVSFSNLTGSNNLNAPALLGSLGN
jgi:predicted outer membrane repeat protein